MRAYAPESVLEAVRRLVHHHSLGLEAWWNLQHLLGVDFGQDQMDRMANGVDDYDASERMSDEEAQRILDHMLYASSDHSQLCQCEEDEDELA